MRSKKLFAIFGLLLVVVPCLAAWSPTELTLDFGPRQITLTEHTLQGGWYNYEAKQKLTGGKNLFARANQMTENDTFAGVFPDIVHYIEKIAPQFETPADPGQVNFHPGANPQFTVTHQADGQIIDRERLYADILTALKGNKFPVIKVPYQTVTPPAPAKIVAEIVERSHFSTKFVENPAREQNIALAAAAFNGLTVQPGETVSFNQVVGARTAARGYQEAKIIVNGEYVDGTGGGVCQVSTTIFNAVAQAGLQIIESHNHTLPSSYVALGKDAMVSGAADLRFVNNTGAPLYFATKVNNHTLTITIYGRDKGPHVTYRLATVTTKETPTKDTWVKDLPAALIAAAQANPANYDRVLVTAGHAGHTVETYLETYKGERRLSRKLLRRSTYQPTPNQYTLRPKSATPDA